MISHRVFPSFDFNFPAAAAFDLMNVAHIYIYTENKRWNNRTTAVAVKKKNEVSVHMVMITKISLQ